MLDWIATPYGQFALWSSAILFSAWIGWEQISAKRTHSNLKKSVRVTKLIERYQSNKRLFLAETAISFGVAVFLAFGAVVFLLCFLMQHTIGDYDYKEYLAFGALIFAFACIFGALRFFRTALDKLICIAQSEEAVPEKVKQVANSADQHEGDAD